MNNLIVVPPEFGILFLIPIIGAYFVFEKTDDLRSYHISSDRLTNELGFRPKRDVPAAVDDLAVAFERGEIPHAMDDPKYYNIRTMQNLALQ